MRRSQVGLIAAPSTIALLVLSVVMDNGWLRAASLAAAAVTVWSTVAYVREHSDRS